MAEKAYKTGNVITINHSIDIFARLCKADSRYAETVSPILLAHFVQCRAKEVALHAECASVCITKDHRDAIIAVLNARKSELSEAQEKGIAKILKGSQTVDKVGGMTACSKTRKAP